MTINPSFVFETFSSHFKFKSIEFQKKKKKKNVSEKVSNCWQTAVITIVYPIPLNEHPGKETAGIRGRIKELLQDVRMTYLDLNFQSVSSPRPFYPYL